MRLSRSVRPPLDHQMMWWTSWSADSTDSSTSWSSPTTTRSPSLTWTASSSSSTPDQHPARPTSATADPEVPDHEAHDPRPTKRHRCPETSTVTEVLMQNCHRCPETSHPVNSAFFNNSFPQDMRTMPFPQACASPFHLRSSRASSTSLPAFRGLPTDRRARCQEHRRALSPRTIRLRDGRTPPPAAPKDRRS